MSPDLVVIIALAIYFIGYKFYATFLAKKLFNLRADASTPAYSKADGVDFVATSPFILFGHHYASIAGLGPILGPAVAVIWGWLPALIWVVFGTLLIGAVHDFSALVLSIRAGGVSIGSVTEYLMGKRAKLLFLLIILFLVSLAMGVFVLVLGFLFSPKAYPQVIAPSTLIMILAMAIGYFSYKKGVSMKLLGSFAFVLIIAMSILSQTKTLSTFTNKHIPQSIDFWKSIMLVYAFSASVLPVWLLLQTRDFLNSLLLYLGMALLYLGFFLSPTEFAAPAVQIHPTNAPSLFPFVFVIIACGAVSGFHSLVSSGTTSKQIQNETHAKAIGYGGMVGESLLGLIAILATTTLVSAEQWKISYGDWNGLAGLTPKIKLFIEGGARFTQALNIPLDFAEGIIAFIVVSFALTSLDSGTRLLRYNIEEIGDLLFASKKNSLLKNRYITSLLAVTMIGFFAFYKIDGKPSGVALWQLFGTTNQLLGALALMTASIYLFSRGKNPLYTLLPMLFVLTATIFAMIQNIYSFVNQDNASSLLIISIILLLMTIWLLIESTIAVFRFRHKKISDLDIVSFK